MAILGKIRERVWVPIAILGITLFAFVADPSTLSKLFNSTKDATILGKVDGNVIRTEEYNDTFGVLKQQYAQQNQNAPESFFQKQSWDNLVGAKLVENQYNKIGFESSERKFWETAKTHPVFADNANLKDKNGNLSIELLKQQIKSLEEKANQGDQQSQEQYKSWLGIKKEIEQSIVQRDYLSMVTSGLLATDVDANFENKSIKELISLEYVHIPYDSYSKANPLKLTDDDYKAYIEKHPKRFDREATRNLGYVIFRGKPSVEDEALAKNEINAFLANRIEVDKANAISDTIEAFQNTKNDSLYVTTYSDAPYQGNYITTQNLPKEMVSFVTTASVGQVGQPLRIGDYYYLSKLQDKKNIDSVATSHVLISYAGTKVPGIKRTKEQAKIKADSIYSAIKANTALFTQFATVNSDDKGAASQGGSIGWMTNLQGGIAKTYQNFATTSSKGQIGLVESEFGFHIIRIDDKKLGSLAYKLATLVKQVKPSEATSDLNFKNANTFVQQNKAKNINEFAAAARSKGYEFFDAKNVTRFGMDLDGLGTDKDGDVLQWAFDDKNDVGATNMFTTSNGQYIVSYLSGIFNKGLASVNAVRAEAEKQVRNEKLGKLINEKIIASGKKDLTAIATMFNTTVQNGGANFKNPTFVTGVEPKVVGAAFGAKPGIVSKPIEGNDGVFVLKTKTIPPVEKNTDLKADKIRIEQQYKQQGVGLLLKSLKDIAKIDDSRGDVLK